MSTPDIRPLPYVTVGGVPTLTDRDIARLYQRLDDEGSVRRLFFDGAVRSAADLIGHFKHPGNMCYLVGYNGDVVGFYWLDNFVQCSCQLHYVFFKAFWGESARTVGRWVLNEMITQRDINGKYCIDVIIGMVPERNRLAVHYSRQVGMQWIGVIPNYYQNLYSGRHEAALATYYTRKED
jgi:hypothetical protein